MNPTENSTEFPIRINVTSLVSSRYEDKRRPEDWDERAEGVDVVQAEGGEQYRLFSDGGQSPPESGWTIMLLGGSNDEGYRWTLYGLPR